LGYLEFTEFFRASAEAFESPGNRDLGRSATDDLDKRGISSGLGNLLRRLAIGDDIERSDYNAGRSGVFCHDLLPDWIDLAAMATVRGVNDKEYRKLVRTTKKLVNVALGNDHFIGKGEACEKKQVHAEISEISGQSPQFPEV
jgi:hypothetical protein